MRLSIALLLLISLACVAMTRASDATTAAADPDDDENGEGAPATTMGSEASEKVVDAKETAPAKDDDDGKHVEHDLPMIDVRGMQST